MYATGDEREEALAGRRAADARQAEEAETGGGDSHGQHCPGQLAAQLREAAEEAAQRMEPQTESSSAASRMQLSARLSAVLRFFFMLPASLCIFLRHTLACLSLHFYHSMPDRCCCEHSIKSCDETVSKGFKFRQIAVYKPGKLCYNASIQK